MIAFDTNILMYASDQRDAVKRGTAHRLLAANADAVLLWQVACEFIAATRKLASQGFDKEQAWDQLRHYSRVMRLVTPSVNTLDRARVLHVEMNVSCWDSMLIAAALEAGVTRLYSEDIPGRVNPGGLEIINPFA